MSREFESPATPPRVRHTQDVISTQGKTPETLIKGMLHTPLTTKRKLYQQFERLASSHTQRKHKPDLMLSPEFTPQKHKKDTIFQLLLPKVIKTLSSKKLTIGSGRLQGLLPSIKINSLLEDLQDPLTFNEDPTLRNLFCEIDCSDTVMTPAEEPQSSIQQKDIESPPATPKRNIITEDLTRNWHGKSHKEDFSDSDDELDPHLLSPSRKPVEELPNPFIESNAKGLKRQISIHNPFVSKQPTIDYNTHTELINKHTGERITRELTSRERAIKPKKLNFDGIINLSSPPLLPAQSQLTFSPTPSPSSSPFSRKRAMTGEINKKYVLKSLNNTINIKLKNELDFEIFNDDEK